MKSFVRSPAFVISTCLFIASIYAMIIFQVKENNNAWLVSAALMGVCCAPFGYGLAKPAKRPWHMVLGGFLAIVTLIFHVVRVTVPMLQRHGLLNS